MPPAAATALLATSLAMIFAAGAEAATVAGTASYRERIAAPPGSTFEAVLLDTARADAPAVEIGRYEKPDAGNPPYPFAIAYDAASIDPRSRLAVRASLRWPDGRLAFTTDAFHAVPIGGQSESVEITMIRVADATGGAAGAAPLTLVGPVWALAEIGGAPPPDGVRADLSFAAEGRVSGTGGCNRVGASYLARPDGAFLAGPGFSTMMACPEPAMATERAVLDALDRARAWSIAGDRLTLADAAGAPLAVFRAQP